MQRRLNLVESHLKEPPAEKTLTTLRQLNSHDLALKLNAGISQTKKLKQVYLSQQTKYLIYSWLNDPSSLQPGSIETRRAATEAEYDAAVAECRVEKAKVEAEKQRIVELVDEIQQLLEINQEKREALKEAHGRVQTKIRYIEEKGGSDKKSVLLNHVQSNLHKISEEISDLETTYKQKTAELADLREKSKELTEALQLFHINNHSTEHILCERRINRYANELELVQCLSGVRVKQLSPHTFHIIMTEQSCTEQNPAQTKDGNEMILEITIGTDTENNTIIAGAKLVGLDIDLSDVASLCHNDLPRLVCEVRDRWLRSHQLQGEIQELRERFGLDWQIGGSVVEVLFGAVCCRLQVDGDIIQLISVSGGHNLLELQPPDNVRTLTQWLLFLQEKLSP